VPDRRGREQESAALLSARRRHTRWMLSNSLFASSNLPPAMPCPRPKSCEITARAANQRLSRRWPATLALRPRRCSRALFAVRMRGARALQAEHQLGHFPQQEAHDVPEVTS
jgi:hypothetical protein